MKIVNYYHPKNYDFELSEQNRSISISISLLRIRDAIEKQGLTIAPRNDRYGLVVWPDRPTPTIKHCKKCQRPL